MNQCRKVRQGAHYTNKTNKSQRYFRAEVRWRAYSRSARCYNPTGWYLEAVFVNSRVIWYHLKHGRIGTTKRMDLHKIISLVPGVVYQFCLRPDGSSCVPYASEAIREIYRLNPEDVREDASRVFAVVHPDDLENHLASIQASARDMTPWQNEYRLKFGDGTVRWLYGNALPQREADGSILWHGFITDITERKNIEDELKQAKERYDYATAIGKVGTWDWDPVTGHLVWSDETFRLLGLTPGSSAPSYELFLGKVHPDDRELLMVPFKRRYVTRSRISSIAGSFLAKEKSGHAI